MRPVAVSQLAISAAAPTLATVAPPTKARGAVTSVERPLSLAVQQVSLGASRRLARPDPEITNPFIDRQDIYNLRAGNPNLAPRDAWSYEAGYSGVALGQDYGLTACYRSDRNAVTDIVRPIATTWC